MQGFDGSQLQQFAQAFSNGNYAELPPQQVAQTYQSFLRDTPDNEVHQIQQDYFNQMPQAERAGLFNGLIHALGGHNNFDPRQAGVSTTDGSRASSMDLGNLFQFAAGSGLLNGLMGGNQRNGTPGGGLFGGLLGGGNQQQSGGGLLGGLLGGNQQPQYPDQYAQPSGNSGDLQDGLRRVLSNPMAQAAISGLVGYAANRALNGGLNSLANRGNQRQQQQNNNMYNNNDQPNFNQGQANWGQGDIQTEPGGGSSLPGFDNRNTQM